MHIPNIIRRAGDFGLMPTFITGMTMGGSLVALKLDKRFNLSEKLFGFIDEHEERKRAFVALGFCVTLAGCVALIKTLPFTQFTSWCRPHFNWTVIEGYLNKA